MVMATGEIKQAQHIESRADNKLQVSQSLKRLRDYINTNVVDVNKCKWITLTYKENMTDTKRLYKDFEKFVCDGALARMADILSKLKKRGVSLTFDEVIRERRCPLSPVHTMYVARAAARKGYSSSPSAFYMEMLAPGRPAYSDAGRPTPEYALSTISECGGISSLAHPGRLDLSNEERLGLIRRLCDCGLRGIEAVYSGHTEKETAYFKEIAAKFSLLVTGGSDTHYAEGSRAIGTPAFVPDEKLLSALGIN